MIGARAGGNRGLLEGEMGSDGAGEELEYDAAGIGIPFPAAGCECETLDIIK